MRHSFSEGEIVEVSINESKIIERCLIPVDMQPAETIDKFVGTVNLKALELDMTMFFDPCVTRLCVVVNVEPSIIPEKIDANLGPPITVVLITTFDIYNTPYLNRVAASGSLSRFIPTRSFVEHFDSPNPLENEGMMRGYILCIPIRVYPYYLKQLKTSVHVGPHNVSRLQSYIASLGDLSVIKLSEDDDYDNDSGHDLFFKEDLTGRARWDEIDFS